MALCLLSFLRIPDVPEMEEERKCCLAFQPTQPKLILSGQREKSAGQAQEHKTRAIVTNLAAQGRREWRRGGAGAAQGRRKWRRGGAGAAQGRRESPFYPFFVVWQGGEYIFRQILSSTKRCPKQFLVRFQQHSL